MTHSIFMFGLGYSARALAESLKAQGWRLSGTTRDADKAARLRLWGVETHVFDGTRPMDDAGRAALAAADHILISAPPGEGGDPILTHHGGDIAARGDGIRWLGYLSTTGVYGDVGGAWIDETAPLAPGSARGRRRVAAEAGWFALGDRGVPVHTFRLSGIYGPGRNQLRGVLDGTARRIVKPGQVFNRIHVEDIAQVLATSIGRPNPGAAYNVADGAPAPPGEVVAYAAELLGRPPPPEVAFDVAEMSPMARSFYGENKRIKIDRITGELGVVLAYPTYREGLAALVPYETAQTEA